MQPSNGWLVLGNSGKEKLPLNIEKPPAEPVCHNRLQHNYGMFQDCLIQL